MRILKKKIITVLVPDSSKNCTQCCYQERKSVCAKRAGVSFPKFCQSTVSVIPFLRSAHARGRNVPILTHLLQSHCRSAAVLLSLVVRCWGLLLVLPGEEALLHPQGAYRMVEGAAHVSVTLCGPAGNGIAAAPPEACSGRRLAVVRSALPPFWHCCHHWLVAMESCQLGWQPLVGLNLVSSLRALKNRKNQS